MGLIVIFLGAFGVMCIYWTIQEKSKDFSLALTCIGGAILISALMYMDYNLERNPKLIKCVVTDRRSTGYLGMHRETTFLYNDTEFTIENDALYQKTRKGDRVEMVVNFIKFGDEDYTIEYVTLVNE